MNAERVKVVSSIKEENQLPLAVKLSGLAIIVVFTFVAGLIAGRSIDSDLFSFNRGSDQGGKKVNLVGDTQNEDSIPTLEFDLYWTVWETMTDQYVDADIVDQEQMFYDSIKGMVNSYGDPATIFLDPQDTETFNENSSGNYFSGIGAELGYENGSIVVISPIEGSPAQKSGIKPGDLIVAVDGEEIASDENIFDVVLRIRGEEGSEVKLTVQHKGSLELDEITIVRGEITLPSMTFKYLEDEDTAVIDLARFTDSSLDEWKKNWDSAVQETIDSGAKTLIIDLRGNPGGYFDAAVYAASEFLPKDTIVAQQEDRNGKIYDFEVKREGKLQDIELVILVNEGSASASEILAGGLKVNNRAEVIGVNTYGKGTAQNVIPFKDGSSLHITVLKWLLPDGTWLNKENPIVPDQVVELTTEDFEAGLDPQMDAAKQFINN